MKFAFRPLAGLLLFSMLLEPSVYSAYDRVVTWSDMSDLDLQTALKSPYASQSNLYGPTVGASGIEIALQDADGRINPDFHVPADLKKPVEFWLKVYTQFTTQQVLFFDTHHQDVIYEVLDFSDLSKTARNAVVYEILRDRKIESARKAYARAFDHLGSKRKRKSPSPEEEKILAAWKKSKHRPSFHELKKNFRSQTGQRDNVIKGLLAAEAFFPKMEKIFRSVGIPPELTRLSLVESSFDLRAYSRVGAVGVWQFMPAPGKKLLMINERLGIDERLSPLKSTVAAGKLLKENYVQFRSWPLAVTSYNHGLRGLMQYRGASSKRSKSFRDIAHLFNPASKKSPLGWAARNYYAEFLAMLHAESYRQMFYGEMPFTGIRPVAYRRLEKRKSALTLALENGVSLQQFHQANPDIRNLNTRLPVGYWVAIPGEHDDLAGLTKKRREKTVLSRL